MCTAIVVLLFLLATNVACAFGPPHGQNHPLLISRRASNLAASSSSSSTTSSTSSTGPPFRLQRIDHIVIRCRDFPRMFDFYHRILGCTIDEPRDEYVNRFGGALTHLRAGSCYIDLLAYDTNHLTDEGREAAKRMHGGGVGLGDKNLEDVQLSSESSTLDHLCLRVDPFDQQQMQSYLEGENVHIVAMGDRRLGADGVGPSVYVSDPEGNVIELKGSPEYQDNARSTIDEKQRMITDVAKQEPMQKGEQIDDEDNTLNDRQEESSTTTTTSNVDVPMTPCNRICRYNSSFYDGQVCIGCFREAFEIGTWENMTPTQKSMTLLDAIDRCSL